MGWLKPAEGLLEPKYAETHREAPPDGPVPEPPVEANGQTVRGVRIAAMTTREIDTMLEVDDRLAKDVSEEEMVVEAQSFDFVPIALLLGIPLMFKRLGDGLSSSSSAAEGGDAAAAEEEVEELRYEQKMYIYKLMTTPGMGLPLTWNQSGRTTRLPPILACRSDGVPFTASDWACLCEFDEYLAEIAVREEHIYHTNKEEFKKWVGLWTQKAVLKSGSGQQQQPHGGPPQQQLMPPPQQQQPPQQLPPTDRACAFAEINPCFETRFPLGLQVKAVGLASKPELNGKLGTVVEYDEPKLRVGVDFGGKFGKLSLKHTSLSLPDGGVQRRSMLLDKARPKRGALRDSM